MPYDWQEMKVVTSISDGSRALPRLQPRKRLRLSRRRFERLTVGWVSVSALVRSGLCSQLQELFFGCFAAFFVNRTGSVGCRFR